MNTIDNTMNAEYTPKSDKNIMSWGRVVKYKCTRDKDITYNVRFNPDWYNITFKSGYDQDEYIIDTNSDIVKAIDKAEKELVRLKMYTKSNDWYDDYNEVTVYGDSPRYKAGYHFQFKDETIAHLFTNLVLTYMKGG